MSATIVRGWLFDTAYIEPEVHVWVLGEQGELTHAALPFHSRFYLSGPQASVEAAVRRVRNTDVAVPEGWCKRIEFWSGKPIPVMAFRVLRAYRCSGLARDLLHADHRLTAYDADLDPTLVFHVHFGLFPLARVAMVHQEGRLRAIRALDDRDDIDYLLPPLRRMTLRLARSPLMTMAQENAILAEVDGRTCCITQEGAAEGLHALNRLLVAGNPDLIESVHGDQVIMPWLLETSARLGVPLHLDRLAPHVRRRLVHEGRTVHVYAGIMYKAPDYPLLGRWHLDLANSFFISKSDIQGAVEMARLSGLPVQRQARTSGGTAITSMEIALALQRGILVPFIKDQVEEFRTAADLLQADKGGLTYFPQVGLWERAIELDFEQQYPSLMVVHNISPETMDCVCCPGLHPVPGVRHHTCMRRRGLVPDALAPLLARRRHYKARLRDTPDQRARYEARRTALKWTLVTTFGYQGFHNAKFGLIAAHEATTAWGRETLLTAKEVFEGAGYRLLHALTDSLYVHKPGFGMDEVERLAAEVKARTGLTLAVEGVYDWLMLLPSKTHHELGVATRYFGRFESGELKMRGIRLRQHNTAPYIRRAQEAVLEVMRRCRSARELCAALPRIRETYQRFAGALLRGQVPLEALRITAIVSRDLEQFRSHSAVHVCLRRLTAAGIRVPAGQTVSYVIVDRHNPDPHRRYVPEPFLNEVRDYDGEAYSALLRDAVSEVAVNIPNAKTITGDYRNPWLWESETALSARPHVS
jgi:DNA polymerase-2